MAALGQALVAALLHFPAEQGESHGPLLLGLLTLAGGAARCALLAQAKGHTCMPPWMLYHAAPLVIPCLKSCSKNSYAHEPCAKSCHQPPHSMHCQKAHSDPLSGMVPTVELAIRGL